MKNALYVSLPLILSMCVPEVCAGASEVWFNEQGASQWIHRVTPGGTLLPRIGTGETSVNDLTVIGNEVWFSVDDSAKIRRLSLDGALLPGTFDSHRTIGDFALVGNEIWISDANQSQWIERWTLDHVELSRFSTGVTAVGGLAVVGDEIWFNEPGASQWINRITRGGSPLPRIGTGETSVNNLTVIGNEVWFSVDDTAKIRRLSLDGALLPGTFDSHRTIGDFALVGDEIWISDANQSQWIERWTLDHVELSSFSTGVTAIGGLAVVPEPATLSLLAGGLCGLLIRRKRK